MGSTFAARYAGMMVADKATLEIFPLHDIPLYNQDADIEPWPPA